MKGYDLNFFGLFGEGNSSESESSLSLSSLSFSLTGLSLSFLSTEDYISNPLRFSFKTLSFL
jgi:hypothetical protein